MKRLLIILFASFCLSPHLGLAAAPPDLPPNVKTLRVNGYDMAYTEHGSGPKAFARFFFNPLARRS